MCALVLGVPVGSMHGVSLPQEYSVSVGDEGFPRTVAALRMQPEAWFSILVSVKPSIGLLPACEGWGKGLGGGNLWEDWSAATTA